MDLLVEKRGLMDGTFVYDKITIVKNHNSFKFRSFTSLPSTSTLSPPLHQSRLVVGSHEQGEYSLVSRASTSSGVRAKSNTSAFSRMRAGVTDLGSGTNP